MFIYFIILLILHFVLLKFIIFQTVCAPPFVFITLFAILCYFMLQLLRVYSRLYFQSQLQVNLFIIVHIFFPLLVAQQYSLRFVIPSMLIVTFIYLTFAFVVDVLITTLVDICLIIYFHFVRPCYRHFLQYFILRCVHYLAFPFLPLFICSIIISFAIISILALVSIVTLHHCLLFLRIFTACSAKQILSIFLLLIVFGFFCSTILAALRTLS